jgi:hypothetical protein
VHIKPERKPNPERNLKKFETLKKSEKTLKEIRKKLIYKIRRASKPDLKSDWFRFGCQISPIGSDVKFNLNIFFRGSGFRPSRSKLNPLPSLRWTGLDLSMDGSNARLG